MQAKPAEIITLLPPWNMGPRNGEKLLRDVHMIVDQAVAEMRGDTGDLSYGFSFGFTDGIAGRAMTSDSVGGVSAIALFRYRFKPETVRKRKREVEKRLRQEYDEDLDAMNAMCGTAYESWAHAAEAVSSPGSLPDDLAAIRRDVLRLYPTMTLVCETPNLVFVPLSYAIAASAEESDSNRALRRLFIALLLHRLFRATIAIHSEPSDIDPTTAAGAAWIPPIPALRSLIGSDWVPAETANTWLERIGAAARLAQVTGYSPRSAIYQTLVADPAEQLLRRIEHESRASMMHVDLIRKLPFFRTSGLYKEV